MGLNSAPAGSMRRAPGVAAPRPASSIRTLLESLSSTDAESRAPTLLLHLLSTFLGVHWAALHALSQGGKLTLLAVATGKEGLFEFLGPDTERSAAALAEKAIKLGTLAPARGSVAGLMHCAPLAVPLLDAGGAAIGCVTLLCKDAARIYTRDEQSLVATLAPLLSLHAMRAALREQAVWMASLGGEGAADAQMLAERVSRIVMDLKAVHTRERAKLEADWVQQRDAIESAAAAREANWAAANAKLEAESRSKDLTLAAAIEGIVKSKDAEMAALVAKHKEELAVARGQPRPPRPAPPVAETLPQPPFPSQPSAPAYPPYFPSASGAYGLDPCSTTSLAVSSSDNLHPALLQVGGAGESQASVAADAADSSFGTAEVSGRPIPKGAVVAGSSKPRVFKPQLDLPKNSEPLPPPLPSNWERKELSGGKVLLLIEALPGPDAIEGEEEEGYRFWVETCSFNQLNFTIDFDGTSNYKIAFDGPNTTASSATAGSVRVGPYLREPLARLKMADRYTDSLLTYRMSWRLGEPDAAAVAAEQAKEARRLSELIEAAAARQQGPMDVREVPQASDKVRRAILKPPPSAAKTSVSVSFVDLDFPPVAESIGSSTRGTTVAGASDSAAAKPAKPGIEASCTWRRPNEFLQGESQAPRVFVDGLSPSDVMQGALGNCWFMCSLAAVAEFPHLIHNLFLDDWPTGAPTAADARPAADASGLYRLRLNKHGQWRELVVDDFFPCRPGSGPVFSQAHGPELWVLLLEKAYAKLHGSYLALRSGMCYEGLADLTGAPCLYRRLDEEDDPDTEVEEKPVTFADLQRYDRNNFVVCCSTPGQDQMTEGGRPGDQEGGLVPGHAYSLISARKLHSGAEILKLRNPWGTFEWQGAWSDNSPEMTDAVRAELDAEEDDGEAEASANDGAFWMSFEDFCKHFVSISVAMAHVPQPPSACNANGVPRCKAPTVREWAPELVKRSKTILAPEVRASSKMPASLRPTHVFDLEVKPTRETKVAVIVGLHQVDERSTPKLPNVDVGVAVLRKAGDGSLALVGSVGTSVSRDRNLELELVPGSYLIVPTTSGAVPPTNAGSAQPSEAPGRLLLDSGDLTAKARQAFDLIAFTFDADMDGLLGEADLTQPAAAAFVDAAGIDTSASGDGHGALKLAAFLNRKATPAALRLALLRSLADVSTTEAEAFWLDFFAACGWGGAGVEPVAEAPRPLVVSVHSGEEVSFTPTPCNAETYETVLCEMIRAKGKEMVVGKVRVYSLATDGGVSFAAFNTDPERTYEITLDASASSNARSHRGTLIATSSLPPGGASPKLLLVILPSDRYEAWSYAYKVSCYAPKVRPHQEKPPPKKPNPYASAPRVAPSERPCAGAPPAAPQPGRAIAKARPIGEGAAPVAAKATLRPVEF